MVDFKLDNHCQIWKEHQILYNSSVKTLLPKWAVAYDITVLFPDSALEGSIGSLIKMLIEIL